MAILLLTHSSGPPTLQVITLQHRPVRSGGGRESLGPLRVHAKGVHSIICGGWREGQDAGVDQGIGGEAREQEDCDLSRRGGLNGRGGSCRGAGAMDGCWGG